MLGLWGQAARHLIRQQQQQSSTLAKQLLQLQVGGSASSKTATCCPRWLDGALSASCRRAYSTQPPDGPEGPSGQDRSGTEGQDSSQLPIAGFEMPELKQSLRPGESLLGEAGGDVVSELSSEARQDNMGRLASEAIRRLSLPNPAFEPPEGEAATPAERFDEVLASWGDMLEEENYDGVMQLMHREFGINPNELFAPVENLRVVTSGEGKDEAEQAAFRERLKESVAQQRVRMVDELGRAYATGKRKTSIARVWLKEPPEGRKGLGNIVVNGRPLDDYFKPILARLDAIAPFDVTATIGKYDVRATVTGGGVTGQAQAVRHGIAKALQLWDPEYRPALKAAGFLTRDSRIVERKKPGKAKARKSFQWVKR